MERKKVYISQVHPNEGQIEGLPANPRLIKDGRFRKLVKSIQDLPEMTEARDLLVYPYGGDYVVIGGNMRLRAYQELGWKEVTVIDFNRPKKSEEHPTMKPIGLFAYLIQNSTKEGDSVLDTFGGSGTTLIACEQLHRRCYMMELDPHYCDVIIARWEKLTGKEAVKVYG